MNLAELQARLRRAHAEIGFAGRFSVTFHEPASGECSILHWRRAEGSAVEDCREIGHGTVEECLAALDRYVAANRPQTAGEPDAP